VSCLVVLPTYNEIANVESMLRALRAEGLDVLVVDDASPDGTAESAEVTGTQLGGICVLRRSAKGGLGSAYRAGFSWGLDREYERLVEIDCDFSHDPSALGGLLEAALDADVVIGSRYVTGGSTEGWSLRRRWLSRAGSLYASTLLDLRVADATSGYRVYSAQGLRAMDYETVGSDGYGFQIEMTDRARRAGLVIREVPITFRERRGGRSKMSGAIVKEALIWVSATALGRLVARATRMKIARPLDVSRRGRTTS
jgi:dolichol-phosphate mannosyltransferase